MKFGIVILPFILSSTCALDRWEKIIRIVPGCHEENILDCVAAFDGKMCYDGDVGFKRDCFDCQCNQFGYWKCRNYCVRPWESRAATILLDDLRPSYSVSATPASVYDQCIPGKRFLRDAEKCQICYCSQSGLKSLSYECKKVWWC